jgi:hypothetical protein
VLTWRSEHERYLVEEHFQETGNFNRLSQRNQVVLYETKRRRKDGTCYGRAFPTKSVNLLAARSVKKNLRQIGEVGAKEMGVPTKIFTGIWIPSLPALLRIRVLDWALSACCFLLPEWPISEM